MEIDCTDNHIEQKLGHCIINWKIENYCLATCKEHWVIESPDFPVRGLQHATKWKMVLNTSLVEPRAQSSTSKVDAISRVTLCLERLDDAEGPDVVWANWKICLLDSKDVAYCKRESKYFFSKKGTYNIDVGTEDFILNKLFPFEVDTLRVYCQLIVQNQSTTRDFKKASDIGLRSLSQDLKVLYKRGKYYDIVLRTDGKNIRAHKAILKFRNDILADIIDKQHGEVIELPQVDYQSMEKIVAYLYTGNLGCVLERPTIMLYKSVIFLKMDELISYYAPDELIAHSTVDSQEFVFLWVVKNFSTRKGNSISSPVLNKDISEVSWKLRLYPTGFARDFQHIAISVEIWKVTKPFCACLEFAVVDTNGQFFRSERVRKYIDRDEIFELKELFERNSLENTSLLTGDVLRIAIKIRISNSVHNPSLGGRMMSLITLNAKEHWYESLSTDMMLMLNNVEFCDLVLIAEENAFNVHKCIIAARSRVLSKMISQVSGEEHKVTLPDIKAKILKILISYLYSGVLQDFETTDVFLVYEAAENFEISPLRDTCSILLQENVEVHNVCDILVFLYGRQDKELKFAAMNFVCLNAEEVYAHPSWTTLEATIPSICFEVTEFVKKNHY